MPDLDTGHLFLTTLAPVKSADDGAAPVSYEQRLRMVLARLPTAMQSPASCKIGENSPFSRNRRTHLARFFVLSDVIYNGRNRQNPLIATARGINPVDPQEVDELASPYLVFCAEIDAVTEDGAPLPHHLTARQQKEVRAAYARRLWATMQDELTAIYSNCVGFEGVRTGDDFAAYLDKCHVPTTMPFHDYYLEPPQFNHLPVKPLLSAVLLPAAVAVLLLGMRLLGMMETPLLGISTLWGALGAGVVTAIAALASIGFALRNGAKPLAPAPHDDLPSVLKALYTQQVFSDFVIDHQGADPGRLHTGFGAFLARHKPADRDAPTQNPGVISIASAGGLSDANGG